MIEVYTAEQVADMLGCSVKTVEDLARRGDLTGIKPGGAWVFPGGALVKRLDELAQQQAEERRRPVIARACAPAAGLTGHRGKAAKARPQLVDLRDG